MARHVGKKKGSNGKAAARSKGASGSESCSTEGGKSKDAQPLSQEDTLALLQARGFGAAQATGRSRMCISPLRVHFSQPLIRPEFQDGTLVEETRETLTSQLSSPLPTEQGYEGVPNESSWWLLSGPFPDIEVIEWQCKLREADGSIKVDEDGEALYSEKDWYTLDNRRLYCLQYAAAKLWPKEVRCIVSVVRVEEGNWREFRKFRTLDCGRSVLIGHRQSPDLPKWSWREEVGLPAEPPPQGRALSRPRRTERRAPVSGGSRSSRRSVASDSDDEPEVEPKQSRLVFQNVLFFFVIYTGMRLVMHIVQRLMSRQSDL